MNKTRGNSEARISRSKCHSGGTHWEPGSQEGSPPHLVRLEGTFLEGILSSARSWPGVRRPECDLGTYKDVHYNVVYQSEKVQTI